MRVESMEFIASKVKELFPGRYSFVEKAIHNGTDGETHTDYHLYVDQIISRCYLHAFSDMAEMTEYVYKMMILFRRF